MASALGARGSWSGCPNLGALPERCEVNNRLPLGRECSTGREKNSFRGNPRPEPVFLRITPPVKATPTPGWEMEIPTRKIH